MDIITFFKNQSKDVRTDIALLLLRIAGGGFMAINHGYGKLLKLFGDEPIKFMDFLGLGPKFSLALAVLAEFVASILIVLGLFTRLSTIPATFTMLIAAFVAHGADPFKRKESALMFLIMYIVILLMGAGKYSLDQKIFGRN